jgi:putative heme-binding domain-containing protein
MRPFFLLAVALVLFGVSPGHSQNLQDHTYTSEDIQAGSIIYAARCAGCHGPNGETIAGVDFRRGVFRRAVTDADLVTAISTGVAGSGMPSFGFQPAEMNKLIAYLRAGFYGAGPPVKLGDRARGQTLVEGKGRCLGCHSVNGRGLRTAPDLSDIGAARSPSSIQRSLLDPTGGMMPINRPVRAMMKNGRTVRGRRLNEDTFTIQMIDEDERLVSLLKVDIHELELGKTSPMPPATSTLTTDEIADVVAYLAALKGL